jgi:hypothetical protein
MEVAGGVIIWLFYYVEFEMILNHGQAAAH